MKIAVIGLGKLGMPCALAIESKGYEVFGYDIDPKVTEILNSRVLPYYEEGAQELLTNTKIKLVPLEQIPDADIVFIAVQTPHEKEYEGINPLPATRKDFDYSYLKQAVSDLKNVMNGRNPTVVIISTVLPGTIEREILPILPDVIYNPFFIAMSTTIRDFLNPEIVLMGWNEPNESLTANKLNVFYHTIYQGQNIGGRYYKVNRFFYNCSIREAEVIKVSYNTFITAKICIANTIMELCHKVGASSDVVMDALKLCTDRIISDKYLNGGMGDGGGCHPRDNIALSWLAREKKLSYDLYEKLMNCRDRQTQWLATIIEDEHKKTSLPVVILGKAFKKNVNLTAGSCAILLTNFLKIPYVHYDPLVDATELPEFSEPSIFFIATNHDIFKTYSFPEGSVIIDPWRYLEKQEKTTLIKIG